MSDVLTPKEIVKACWRRMLVEMDQMSLAGNSPDAEKKRCAQIRRPFMATGRHHMVGRVGLGLNLRIVGNEASVSSTQE